MTLITNYFFFPSEWKTVVQTPSLRTQFSQFINTPETEPTIGVITERGQQRPADWPKHIENVPVPVLIPTPPTSDDEDAVHVRKEDEKKWIKVGTEADFPLDGGAAIKYGNVQIAVFRMMVDGVEQWFATQNVSIQYFSLALSLPSFDNSHFSRSRCVPTNVPLSSPNP